MSTTTAEERQRPWAGAERRWLLAALALMLVVKVGTAGVWTGGIVAAVAAPPVAAEERGAEEAGAALRAGGASRPPVRDLLSALAQRQQELDDREQELTQRTERLQLLQQDVTAKLAALEQIEKRLSGIAETRRTSGAEAAQSLAKIYAAMKPGEAAPILDQLDDETVLTIFRRMKEKQIGEILPLMSRQRAIVLTQAIALRR